MTDQQVQVVLENVRRKAWAWDSVQLWVLGDIIGCGDRRVAARAIRALARYGRKHAHKLVHGIHASEVAMEIVGRDIADFLDAGGRASVIH